jgi:hypothetical protein
VEEARLKENLGADSCLESKLRCGASRMHVGRNDQRVELACGTPARLQGGVYLAVTPHLKGALAGLQYKRTLQLQLGIQQNHAFV